MKIKHLVSVLIASISLFSCYQQKYLSTKWQKETYSTIDSIPIFDYLYNSEHKVFYMITNDEDNLYVHLKTIDVNTQGQITQNGLTIWIDTTAKSKEKIGLIFPLAMKDRINQMPIRINRSGNRNKEFENIESQIRDIELIGFEKEGGSSLISSINQKGIRGKIKFINTDEMLYVLVIPLNILWKNSIKKDKLFSIKIESGLVNSRNTNARPQGNTKVSSGGRGSGQRGGGGVKGSGQRSGGGGHTGEMRINQSTPQIKISIKKMKLLND